MKIFSGLLLVILVAYSQGSVGRMGKEGCEKQFPGKKGFVALKEWFYEFDAKKCVEYECNSDKTKGTITGCAPVMFMTSPCSRLDLARKMCYTVGPQTIKTNMKTCCYPQTICVTGKFAKFFDWAKFREFRGTARKGCIRHVKPKPALVLKPKPEGPKVKPTVKPRNFLGFFKSIGKSMFSWFKGFRKHPRTHKKKSSGGPRIIGLGYRYTKPTYAVKPKPALVLKPKPEGPRIIGLGYTKPTYVPKPKPALVLKPKPEGPKIIGLGYTKPTYVPKPKPALVL